MHKIYYMNTIYKECIMTTASDLIFLNYGNRFANYCMIFSEEKNCNIKLTSIKAKIKMFKFS